MKVFREDLPENAVIGGAYSVDDVGNVIVVAFNSVSVEVDLVEGEPPMNFTNPHEIQVRKQGRFCSDAVRGLWVEDLVTGETILGPVWSGTALTRLCQEAGVDVS